MLRPAATFFAPALVALALGGGADAALAVQACELNGQPINPDNGSTTEGKTGLMRCRDGQGGAILREQELQHGKFMGAVRYFQGGVLEKEYRVNERGNRDGLAREWSRADAAGKSVLVREETYRDGHNVGLAKSWYPSGTLRRLTFYGDDEREQAYAEFNMQGQLYELRCAARPVLGSDFDDKAACGFSGAPSTVVFYGGKGQPRARAVFVAGVRQKSDTLWDSGAVRDEQEATAGGGIERSFAADGTKRHELQWVALTGGRSGRITTLEQEFHESGKLVRERRWKVGERGGEPVSDARWYLNGQPKALIEYVADNGRTLRRDVEFHDNGRKSFEGSWLVGARGERDESAIGTHRRFDADGHLRLERTYDERGHLSHERELDENGKVGRDDEVFEDGSRKAVGR